MAEVTVNNVVSETKTPTVIGGGVLLGLLLQKFVNNKILGSETVKGLLGDTTTSNLKKFVSPALVTATGIVVNMKSKDEFMRNLAAGVAISGPVNVGMQVLFHKDPLSGFGIDGFLGDLLGDFLGDDEDDLGDTDDDDDLGDADDPDDLGDNDEDDALRGLGNAEIEENNNAVAALPVGNIKLNVEQSENNQMEGSIGDLLPSKAPGVRDPFPEPIFAGMGEDINLL